MNDIFQCYSCSLVVDLIEQLEFMKSGSTRRNKNGGNEVELRKSTPYRKAPLSQCILIDWTTKVLFIFSLDGWIGLKLTRFFFHCQESIPGQANDEVVALPLNHQWLNLKVQILSLEHKFFLWWEPSLYRISLSEKAHLDLNLMVVFITNLGDSFFFFLFLFL